MKRNLKKYLPKKEEGGNLQNSGAAQAAKDAVVTGVSMIPGYGQVIAPALKVMDSVLGPLGTNEDGTQKEGLVGQVASNMNPLGGVADIANGDWGSFANRATFGLAGFKTKADKLALKMRKEALGRKVQEGEANLAKATAEGFDQTGDENATMFGGGGSIKRGLVKQYVGDKHEAPSGGIPVDDNGNVNNDNPVALVEGGETKYNYKGEPIVFSDKVVLPNGQTLAEKSLHLRNNKPELDKLSELQLDVAGQNNNKKMFLGGLFKGKAPKGLGFNVPKTDTNIESGLPTSKPVSTIPTGDQLTNQDPLPFLDMGEDSNIGPRDRDFPVAKGLSSYKTPAPDYGIELNAPSGNTTVGPQRVTQDQLLGKTSTMYNTKFPRVKKSIDLEDLGDKATALGGDIANLGLIENLKGASPMRKTAFMQGRKVNNSDELRSIDETVATTQAGLKGSTSQNTTADRIATAVAGMNAKSGSYERMNNTNAQLGQQTDQMNTRIDMQNSAIDKQNADNDIELNNKKQQLRSQTFSNISNTMQGMNRDKKLMQLDKDKFKVLSDSDVTGVVDRNFEDINFGRKKKDPTQKRLGGRLKNSSKC